MPRPVRRLFAISIFARTPGAAIGLLFIVRTRELTGSYAASGLVAGVASIAGALSAPGIGRLVDRRGQTRVLAATGGLTVTAIAAFGLLPDGVPLAAPLLCAAVAGAAAPPLGACLRTLYRELLGEDALHRAYAFESAALEITYVAGPLLLLGLATVTSAAAALLVGAAILGAGTAAYAATRESRDWRGATADAGAGSASAIRSPGLRTIVIAIALVGATFGAIEVAVPAACQAAGTKGATGPLLAVWGLGSMLGGFLAARAAAPADAARWLTLLLLGLTAGDLLLVPAASLAVLAPLLLVAGAGIAPLLGTANGLIDRVAPEGALTEAFAWLSTAIGVGLAAGSSAAGVVIDAASPSAGFAVAAAAGLLAAAVTAARRASLATPGTVPSVA
jgi:predicted MFS family arabinose efflux permease